MNYTKKIMNLIVKFKLNRIILSFYKRRTDLDCYENVKMQETKKKDIFCLIKHKQWN